LAAGAVTINYGNFFLSVISFLVIAAIVFFLVVRPLVHFAAPKKSVAAPAPVPNPLVATFCLLKWLSRLGVKTLFIEKGSPWENGYIESFNEK
jgi:large-conductance mechanosensitive channel